MSIDWVLREISVMERDEGLRLGAGVTSFIAARRAVLKQDRLALAISRMSGPELDRVRAAQWKRLFETAPDEFRRRVFTNLDDAQAACDAANERAEQAESN